MLLAVAACAGAHRGSPSAARSRARSSGRCRRPRLAAAPGAGRGARVARLRPGQHPHSEPGARPGRAGTTPGGRTASPPHSAPARSAAGGPGLRRPGSASPALGAAWCESWEQGPEADSSSQPLEGSGALGLCRKWLRVRNSWLLLPGPVRDPEVQSTNTSGCRWGQLAGVSMLFQGFTRQTDKIKTDKYN